MNKNWILLLFAIIGLASCSIEKRVYQPGYHIEWNRYAEQDASRDVAQDASQDLSENLSENLETDVSQDLPQDLSKNLETGASQDLPQDLSKNLETDVSQGRSEGASQDASQDLPQELSENLETDVSQDFPQDIDPDLELTLYVILSLFLPALTVFLMEGFSKYFWIALLLMILAFTLPVPMFLQLLIEGLATVLAIAIVLHYL
jgi:uncharacterized membrane protein YqaE (UPF0057 family)